MVAGTKSSFWIYQKWGIADLHARYLSSDGPPSSSFFQSNRKIYNHANSHEFLKVSHLITPHSLKMALPATGPPGNLDIGPTETTALPGRRNSKSSSSSIANNTSTAAATLSSLSNESNPKKGSSNGGSDVEAGEVDEPKNPLFERNSEMLAKMHFLFPATALGVSIFTCFLTEKI
jgi:hypothetical protein